MDTTSVPSRLVGGYPVVCGSECQILENLVPDPCTYKAMLSQNRAATEIHFGPIVQISLLILIIVGTNQRT